MGGTIIGSAFGAKMVVSEGGSFPGTSRRVEYVEPALSRMDGIVARAKDAYTATQWGSGAGWRKCGLCNLWSLDG